MVRTDTGYRLANGVTLPWIAFGTSITFPLLFGNGMMNFASSSYRRMRRMIRYAKKETQYDLGVHETFKATASLIPCIQEAYKNDIRLFDCSRGYSGSEQRLGKAIEAVPRENVFIITKIDNGPQFAGRVEECFEESLRQLNTDYVDLLLLHWPIDYPKIGDERFDHSVPIFARSWRVLEDIYGSGRARAIGVSNFNIVHLELLKEYARIMPMADEFECHPLCIRKDLNAYCESNDIQVIAYAALCAMDRRLCNDAMQNIAMAHGKTIGQVILKWHMQQGRIPIFGTSKPERIREYAHLSDFFLTDDELAVIDGQNINYRAHPDSEHCDFTKGIWIGWEDYKDCCP